MKKTFLLLLVAAPGMLAIQSCKVKGCTDILSITYDPDAEKDDGSCAYGGTGGNTTIVAKPQHHGTPIVSKIGYVDSAFIKFDAIESPGTNPAAYDLIIAGEEGEDHVHIPNMKPGKYYIYMTGFDSTIVSRVSGGIPVSVSQTSGETDIAVPVSE